MILQLDLSNNMIVGRALPMRRFQSMYLSSNIPNMQPNRLNMKRSRTYIQKKILISKRTICLFSFLRIHGFFLEMMMMIMMMRLN
jgi:hypothetical protein